MMQAMPSNNASSDAQMMQAAPSNDASSEDQMMQATKRKLSAQETERLLLLRMADSSRDSWLPTSDKGSCEKCNPSSSPQARRAWAKVLCKTASQSAI